MDRYYRLTNEEWSYLISKVHSYNKDLNAHEVLENIPSQLFGIALDFGFNETEVRDWIYEYCNKLNQEVEKL